MGGNQILGEGGRVHSNAGTAGGMVGRNTTGRRGELLRALRIDSTFDAVPTKSDVLLSKAEFFPGCRSNLFLDDVQSGDHLCDGMFHLNASVHFQKVGVAVRGEEEFYGSNIFVTDGLHGLDDLLSQFLSEFLRKEGAWRFLDQLLMTALNGALPFSQMNHVTVLVCQNLKFDMAGAFQVAFGINLCAAEGALSF